MDWGQLLQAGAACVVLLGAFGTMLRWIVKKMETAIDRLMQPEFEKLNGEVAAIHTRIDTHMVEEVERSKAFEQEIARLALAIENGAR